MKSYRAYATLAFYVELPDDDALADKAFDDVISGITTRLNERPFAHVAPGSFGVDDADTEPDE